MHKLSAGILGASGYAGRELCSLVLGHPSMQLAFAAANERRGERARLAGGVEVTFDAPEDVPLGACDVVFCALPHGMSGTWAMRARTAGAKVVDLSADLRPGSEQGGGGSCADVVLPSTSAVATARRTVYGLTELAREAVREAEIVANPGCYPTAILLALAPLLERGLVSPGATISISAASGVTGAGFTPRHDLLFAEVAEDFRAYAADNTHRHLGEMRGVLAAYGSDAELLFVPHLLPVARGILATITVPLAEPLEDPLAPWLDAYADEPFIEVNEALPSLRDVVRRNVVRIGVRRAQGLRVPTLTVFAAIDNLVKGAAGQALQNANLMLGVDERAGLPT